MAKYLLALTFLTCSYCLVLGQTEYKFSPKWKVGDKRTAVKEQRETEYIGGELVEDTTIYLDVTMIVLKENKDNFILQVIYENVALRAAINFYDKLGDELTDYQNLELKYRIDKQTGNADLDNWKEAQQFMNESLDQINSILEEKVPDMVGFAQLAFAPIEEMFKSKENIEAYMSGGIEYLLFPYDKTFVLGDTLSITEMCANPFNPMDSINLTTMTYLTNVDELKNTCNINSTQIFDLTGFKEMMKSMMGKMTESYGAADSTRNKAAKEIDSIELDITDLTVITFDYGTSWPIKVVQTRKVYANDPKGKREKTVLNTVTMK